MKNLVAKVKALWNRLPDNFKRPLHTFWQAFVAVFLVGASGILSALLKTHNVNDAESALLALITAAFAAGCAAVKALWLSRQTQ